MKKIAVIAICILALLSAGKASARGRFIGGGLSARWTPELFNSPSLYFTRTEVAGGFEFNERWATGLVTGLEYGSSSQAVILNAYARYTPWHNDVIYIDAKAVIISLFWDTVNIRLGLMPSLRFRVAPRWEVFTDVGFFGVDLLDFEASQLSAFITNTGAGVGVYFRF